MRRFNQGGTGVAITIVAGAPHLAAELFTRRAGIALVYPPYEGSAQALTDLTARQAQGHVQRHASFLPDGQEQSIAPVGSIDRNALAQAARLS